MSKRLRKIVNTRSLARVKYLENDATEWLFFKGEGIFDYYYTMVYSGKCAFIALSYIYMCLYDTKISQTRGMTPSTPH